MAKIENQPKVVLTQDEREILRKAQIIFNELEVDDKDAEIYYQCDIYNGKWCWLGEFIERLITISEVE